MIAGMDHTSSTGPSPGRLETTAAGDVSTAVASICEAAQTAGMTVFARIDHAVGARDAGLELADEVLLIVGAPKVGTALMQAAPRAGLDLPLHVLVWDDAGTTRITWRDPRLLAAEHPLDGLAGVLDAMGAALLKLVGATA